MISEIFLYISIIIFASGQIGRFPISEGFTVQLIDAVVVLAVSLWVIEKIIKKRLSVLRQHNFLNPMVIFAGIALISLLLSPLRLSMNETLISGMYLIRWIAYALLFFVVRDLHEERKKRLFIFLLSAGFATVLAGLLQYFFYPNLRNLFYLGWDDHLYRLFSVYFDPNFAAAMFNLLLFALIPACFGKRPRYLGNVLVARLLFIISFIALLLTYSRSGYVMFAIGSVSALWLLKKRKTIITIISILLLGIVLLPKNLGSSGVELWRTASIFARTEAAKQAVSIFVDHPFLGVGFNTYRYAQREYGFEKAYTWELSHSGAGTDNSFLFILATTGIVGFAGYIFLLLTLVRDSYGKYMHGKTESEKSFAVIVIASIIGLCIDSVFINSLFYPHVMFWVWILVGFMERKSL